MAVQPTLAKLALDPRRRSTVHAVLALAASTSLVLLTSCDRAADRDEPRPVTSAERGEALFRAYCARCHGAGGVGDGPDAQGLSLPPPDLTTLAARNGDLFIQDAVAAYVDGRRLVESHGPRDMPVWGRVLDDRNTAADQELRLTPDMIGSIVEHLRTLQGPRRPASADPGEGVPAP